MAAIDPFDPEDYLRLVVAIVAIAVAGIAFLAYRRRPTTRMLLVAIAFVTYGVKAAVLLAELAYPESSLLGFLDASMDAGFILLIAAATLKA